MNERVRLPPSSDNAATNVPFGDSLAAVTIAGRVNTASPVGSDWGTRGDALDSTCLHDAASAANTIRMVRTCMVSWSPSRGEKSQPRWLGSRQQPGFELLWPILRVLCAIDNRSNASITCTASTYR